MHFFATKENEEKKKKAEERRRRKDEKFGQHTPAATGNDTTPGLVINEEVLGGVVVPPAGREEIGQFLQLQCIQCTKQETLIVMSSIPCSFSFVIINLLWDHNNKKGL